MPISFVNSAEVNKATTSSSSFTGSYTVGTGDNRLLVVGIVFIDTGIDVTVTGMTYGGVAMTFINRVNNGAGNRGVELWYLLNPATGSNTLAGTFSGASSNGYSAIALDYSGVKQSAQPDASATNTTTGTSLTTTVTTIANNCWLVGIGGNNASTAGANTVLRTRSTQANSTGFVTMDTGTFQNPAGSHSMTINISSAFSDCMAIASFAPASDLTYGETLGSGSSTTKLLLHLNGNSTDSSGNNNNGTDTNITYVDGKFGKCASFNGTSSKIAIPNDTNLKTTNQTIACWVKFTSATYACFVVNNFYNGSFWQGLQFGTDYNNTGKLLAYVANGSGSETLSIGNKLVNDGLWHHVVLTQAGTANNMYVDGLLDKSTTTVTPAYYSNNSPTIGARNVNGSYSQFHNGLIDEVIIENRAWSAQEVAKYYTYSKGYYSTI